MRCHSMSSGSCGWERKCKYWEVNPKSMKGKELTNLWSLLKDFLNVVLAEGSMAGVVYLTESRNWLGLASRHNTDLLQIPARALSSPLDAVQYRFQRRRCWRCHWPCPFSFTTRSSTYVKGQGDMEYWTWAQVLAFLILRGFILFCKLVISTCLYRKPRRKQNSSTSIKFKLYYKFLYF